MALVTGVCPAIGVGLLTEKDSVLLDPDSVDLRRSNLSEFLEISCGLFIILDDYLESFRLFSVINSLSGRINLTQVQVNTNALL